MKGEKIGRKKCFNKKNKVHFELNEFSGKNGTGKSTAITSAWNSSEHLFFLQRKKKLRRKIKLHHYLVKLYNQKFYSICTLSFPLVWVRKDAKNPRWRLKEQLPNRKAEQNVCLSFWVLELNKHLKLTTDCLSIFFI